MASGEPSEPTSASIAPAHSDGFVPTPVAAIVAADRAGAGAWVERKPSSVVLHVRQADDTSGAAALLELADWRRRVAALYAGVRSAAPEVRLRFRTTPCLAGTEKSSPRA